MSRKRLQGKIAGALWDVLGEEVPTAELLAHTEAVVKRMTLRQS